MPDWSSYMLFSKLNEMKRINIFSHKWHFIKMLSVSAFLVAVMAQCEIQPNFTYEPGNPGGKLNVNAWEYIQQNDSLSMMKDAILATGLQDFYSGTSDSTFIVPRNSAWRAYLKSNSYASMADIPDSVLTSVVKYHIVKAKVIFNDPALMQSDNPIAYDTENGQVMYLSHNSNFQGLINEGTKKSWTIITSNLEPTNGVIHITKDVVYLSE